MGTASIRPAGKSPLPGEPAPSAPDASTRAFLRQSAALAALATTLAAPVTVLAQSVADPNLGTVRNTPGHPIGILFPELADPYRKVFEEIVAGIEMQARQRVRAWPLAPSHNAAELAAALKRGGTRVVIALGRQGLRSAAALDASIGVIVGGVSSVPDGERQVGVCLTPDPALLFAQLKTLLPATRRVVVIHNPQHNEWLMRLAREAAHAAGLELTVFEARDLAAAARLFEAALAGADRKRDALWLPIDPTTVDEATIMPIVLRESWNRSIPVFSSSLLHVSKGVLFALYPNNTELGRTLGNLASSVLAGENIPRGVAPLRDVHAALNTRTASHIGLTLDARMQRAFQTIFPPP